MNRRKALGLGWGCLLGWIGLGADWPQWFGPERNGVSTETIRSQLPADGLKPRWSVKVGTGWSGPVVVGNRVLLHHRRGDEEILEAWDTVSGKPAWRSAQPTHYDDSFGFDNGPRGTPCVAAGQVFTFGAEGRLTCVRLAEGTVAWTRPLGTELKGDAGFFGFACSPLVVSNRVIVQLGGADGAGIVALNCRDGSLAWKATRDEASYAAPVTMEREGQTCIVVFNRAGFVLLEPGSGTVLQRHPWRPQTHASVNAATPLVWGQRVFLTTSYDTGAILLDVAGKTPKSLWENDETLSAHYASVVARDGLAFGFHGRQERGPSFRCFDLATGKVRWTESGAGGGGSVLRANGTLILLRDSGELQLAPADGDAFRPTARIQLLGTQTRAMPALADGTLYARDRTQLVAVGLGE